MFAAFEYRFLALECPFVNILFNRTILPYLSYCNIIWAANYHSLLLQ